MDRVERAQAYQDSRRIVLGLLIEHAFSKRRVTLSSGKESDFYINCKKALTQKGLLHIGELFYAEMERWFTKRDIGDIVGVGGMETGAILLAATTSLAACRMSYAHCIMSPFYIRKEPKKHGTQDWLEGPDFAEGAPVVIVEDVITTGASTIKAIERARMHKLVPKLVVALVDRLEEDGRQNIEATGVHVQALFARTDFPL